MFKNFIKITAAAFVWSRYKKLIIATACLFFYIWLIGIFHDDYLTYSKIEGGGDSLGLSFLFKWLAWLLGIAVYFLYQYFADNQKNDSDQQIGTQNLFSPDFTGTDKSKIKSTTIHGDEQETDPFSHIRERKRLRSRADLLIEKTNKE